MTLVSIGQRREVGKQLRIAHFRCGIQLFLFWRPISGYCQRTGQLKQESKCKMKDPIRKRTHPDTMAGKSWETCVIRAIMIP